MSNTAKKINQKLKSQVWKKLSTLINISLWISEILRKQPDKWTCLQTNWYFLPYEHRLCPLSDCIKIRLVDKFEDLCSSGLCQFIGNSVCILALRGEKACVCSSDIVYLSFIIYVQLGIIGINGSQRACRNKGI